MRVDHVLAAQNRGELLAIVKYPDNDAAFRVLAKIAKLEVVDTDKTFPSS